MGKNKSKHANSPNGVNKLGQTLSNEAKFHLALEFIQNKKTTDAKILLNEILLSDSRHAESWFYSALIADNQGLHQDAIRYLESALEIDPQNLKYLYTIGDFYYEQNYLDKGVKIFELIISIKPEDYNGYYNLAGFLNKQKKYEQSLLNYHKVLELHENNINTIYNIGAILIDTKKYENAIQYFQKVIDSQPNSDDALNNLGFLYLELNGVENAIEYLNRALSINPNNFNALNNLGKAYEKKSLFQEAIKCFDAVIHLKPDYAEAYANLGNTFKELEIHEKALNAYNTAIILNPNLAEVFSNRGNIFTNPKSDLADTYLERGDILRDLKLKMKIHWLIPGNYKSIEDISKAQLASIRMRTGLVAKYSSDIQIEFSSGDHVDQKADVIVVGKIGVDCHNGRDNLWLKYLLKAREQSKIIVIDYTDNHLAFINTSMGVFYKKILPIIDKAIVPSSHMSVLLSQFFKKEITIIEDPLEIESISPKIPTHKNKIPFLWFGHASNISYLIQYLKNPLLCDVGVKLNFLSNNQGIELLLLHKHLLNANIEFNISEWTLQNMINAAKISDACLIPSDLNDPLKSGVSSNRLITAFALGLPVTADLLESYAPFSDYFHNIREEPLSVFIKQLNLYVKKCELAQANVVSEFRQDNIVKKWNSFFNKLIIN